jgi:hypothetical protein
MNKKKFRAAAIKAGYRSGFEDDVAKELRSKDIEFTYEKEKIKWVDIKVRTYTPDFVLSNGIIIETKGRFVANDRRKHKEIAKQFPDLDIRFVFQNSRAKLYKGAKSSYADWCKKYGFQYAEKTIPDDWLKE